MFKLFFAIAVNCLFSVTLFSNVDFHYDFAKDHDGWVGNFADYPIGEEEFYELEWSWVNLPKPLPDNAKGMMLSGNNHSDDLLMYLAKRLDGLEPNTEYDLLFNVMIETNVGERLMGVGGSPGESVFFKVGASNTEPKKIEKQGYYRINLDIGSQSNGGSEGIVIGNLANPLVDPNDPQYAPKEMYNSQKFTAKTDENGSLWVILGTDSGFEGFTRYYIANISITASK